MYVVQIHKHLTGNLVRWEVHPNQCHCKKKLSLDSFVGSGFRWRTFLNRRTILTISPDSSSLMRLHCRKLRCGPLSARYFLKFFEFFLASFFRQLILHTVKALMCWETERNVWQVSALPLFLYSLRTFSLGSLSEGGIRLSVTWQLICSFCCDCSAPCDRNLALAGCDVTFHLLSLSLSLLFHSILLSPRAALYRRDFLAITINTPCYEGII